MVKVWPDYDGNGQIKPYLGGLNFKGRRCVEVQGQVDAQGRRPWITSERIDGKLKGGVIAHATQGQPEIQNRGLIIKNMEVSGASGDCVMLGNKARFGIIHNSKIRECGHHGFMFGSSKLPPTAWGYLELVDNEFQFAKSHLVYGHRLARAHVVNNRCSSPGWGHCLRILARTGVIAHNTVSNVGLDGQVEQSPSRPEKLYVGMHPLEVGVCTRMQVHDNTVIMRYQKGRTGKTGLTFRRRNSINNCEILRRQGDFWQPLYASSPEFQAPALWDEIGAEVSRLQDRRDAESVSGQYLFIDYLWNNTFYQLGDADHAVGFVTKPTYPTHEDDGDRMVAEVKNLVASLGADWGQVRAEASPELKWLMDHTMPGHQEAVLKGRLLNQVPKPGPENWRERGAVLAANNQVLRCPQGPDPATCTPVPKEFHYTITRFEDYAPPGNTGLPVYEIEGPLPGWWPQD